MAASLELSETAIEALAQRVVELLTKTEVSAVNRESLVDAAAVATRYSVEPAWVYAHAEELGAIKLGTGAKPRLRFDLEKVARALASCSSDRGSQPPESPAAKPRSRQRPGQETGTKRDLLPIRGVKTPKSAPTRPLGGSKP